MKINNSPQGTADRSLSRQRKLSMGRKPGSRDQVRYSQGRKDTLRSCPRSPAVFSRGVGSRRKIMINKRFYFDVGDTDNGRISLVRGFFFGFLKDLELQGHAGIIDCPTLNKTHSCPMAAYKDTYKTVDLGDGDSFEDYDRAFTDPDNIEGKEAFIEFLVDHKGESTYTRMIELCNELIKLDEG